MSTTDKLTDEAAPDYKGFTEAIMENWAAHGDIDAGEKFDLAVKFNILRPILGGYDPEKHSCEWCDADRGDPWYEMNRRASQAAPAPSDALRDALATLLVQANGVEPRDDRLRQNVVRIARAALSTPTEERQ